MPNYDKIILMLTLITANIGTAFMSSLCDGTENGTVDPGHVHDDASQW
jgi:hypothetical protein